MSCGAPCTQGLKVEGSGCLGSVVATDRAAACSAQPGWSHTAPPALQELGAGQPALSARSGQCQPSQPGQEPMLHCPAILAHQGPVLHLTRAVACACAGSRRTPMAQQPLPEHPPSHTHTLTTAV